MNNKFVIDMDWIDKRIEQCHKRVKAYPEKLNIEKILVIVVGVKDTSSSESERRPDLLDEMN